MGGVFQIYHGEYSTNRYYASPDKDESRDYDQLMAECRSHNTIKQVESKFEVDVTCNYNNTISTILLDTSPRGYNGVCKIRSISISENVEENTKALYIALRWLIDIVMVENKKQSVYGTLKFSTGDYISTLEKAGFTINYKNDTHEHEQ